MAKELHGLLVLGRRRKNKADALFESEQVIGSTCSLNLFFNIQDDTALIAFIITNKLMKFSSSPKTS
jgi:hypothetical protein